MPPATLHHRIQIAFVRQLQLDMAHRLAPEPCDQVGTVTVLLVEEPLLVKRPGPIGECGADHIQLARRRRAHLQPGGPSVSAVDGVTVGEVIE